MADTSFITDRDRIAALKTLVATLRLECPWDKKQTPDSIIRYLIEEAYELMDAIASGDTAHIAEELGDVLFQVIFIAQLYQEKGLFSLDDAAEGILEKMVRRHPHVFGEGKAETPEQVKDTWAVIKASEKNDAGRDKSLLDSVPSGLPSLHRAYMISEKVGRAGFDWDHMSGVTDKVVEEWRELAEAIASGDKEQIELEFGDLLFTLTNVARFADIHPETALAASVRKFEARYRHMEKRLAEAETLLSALSPEEKDRLWEKAKKDTK